MEHFPLKDRLHTDVLEEKYGPVHSEFVRHNNKVREVHIVDERGVSRTYAITFFTFDRKNEEVVEIDNQIKHGGLIGKTFREHGYEIRKNVITVFLTNLPDKLKEKMETAEGKAKVRLSEFYAKKEGAEPIVYGVVSEIYSPDFRPAEINEVDEAQDNPTSEAFEKAGINKNTVWEKLGENNNWGDLKEEFELAKSFSQGEEARLKDQVEEYIVKNN